MQESLFRKYSRQLWHQISKDGPPMNCASQYSDSHDLFPLNLDWLCDLTVLSWMWWKWCCYFWGFVRSSFWAYLSVSWNTCSGERQPLHTLSTSLILPCWEEAPASQMEREMPSQPSAVAVTPSQVPSCERNHRGRHSHLSFRTASVQPISDY